MKLAELTWPDLEQVSRDLVVVYPIAALEQHGPHLPFITDTAEVAAIIDRLDAEIPDEILCLPVQWLGYSPHHMRFKGTITARSETHISMIVDTVSSMVSAEFDKIAIINGHGGIPHGAVNGTVDCLVARLKERLDIVIGLVNGTCSPGFFFTFTTVFPTVICL